MKTLLRFILNLTVTVAIMIPCILFFKRIYAFHWLYSIFSMKDASCMAR